MRGMVDSETATRVPDRPVQTAIALLLALAFLLLSVRFGLVSVGLSGSVVVLASAWLSSGRPASPECALGVGVVLFLGGTVVGLSVLVGPTEDRGPGVVAAALSVAGAQAIWAVRRCPCRARARGPWLTASVRGLVFGIVMAACGTLRPRGWLGFGHDAELTTRWLAISDAGQLSDTSGPQ